MPALELPPWLEAARPADYMAKGMGIGAELSGQRLTAERAQEAAAQRAQEFQQQMSAEQAAQQFKMQQAARQNQLAAQEQARADVETQLKASQMADRSKAILQYQAAIAGGMNSLDAMIKFGPGMGGQASPEAAALRAQQADKPPVWVPANPNTGEPAHYLEGNKIAPPPRTTAYIPDTITTQSGQVIEGQRNTGTGEFKPYSSTINPAPGRLTQQDRAELMRLKDEESKLLELAPLIRRQMASGKPMDKVNQDIANQLREIDQRRSEILPDSKQPGTKSADGGRVRVKSPDGKVGSIPEDQLEEALAHGYTKA